MNVLLILPILIPLLTGATGLLLWRFPHTARMVSVVGALALLGAAIALISVVWSEGIQVVQAGNWPAPFGITLVDVP